MKIETFPHDDANEFFWSKMGRFFASAKVRSDLGGYVTSDTRFTWWLAFDDANQVMGFCASRRDKTGAQVYLTYDYVLPNLRGQGIYCALFQARLEAVLQDANIKRLFAVCGKMSLGMYEKHGFVTYGQRGGYTLVERIVHD
jgi:ribosomal protein S18 acetylase RimI-like enzyme